MNKEEFDKAVNLIRRNTDEIIGEEELFGMLKADRKPVIYWGTAPTGRPHVGYFFPMLKIADLLKAGCKVKVLLADLHAALDNTPWEVLDYRYEYYLKTIKYLRESIRVDKKDLDFVKGSDFQLKRAYVFDVLKMSSFSSLRDAKRAAAEVVKNMEGDKAKLSGLIYPIMQNCDEVYLESDAQLGGTDQRNTMVLARENLPKLGYKPRTEIIHKLIPGLIGEKMSSSVEGGKIDLLDDEETVKKKMKKAECEEGKTNNGILPFVKYVLMTIKKDKQEKLVVKRPEKFGGNIEYEDYESLEKDFVEKKLHPLDLKNAVSEEINKILFHIRKHKEELEEISKRAYPQKNDG